MSSPSIKNYENSSRNGSPEHYQRSPSRERSRSRSPRRGSPPSRSNISNNLNNSNCLCIRGLATYISAREIENKISNFGKVLSCQLIIDPRTRESRGFAFVAMETKEQADQVIEKLKIKIGGKTWSVEKAKRGKAHSPTPGQYLGSDRRRYGQLFQ
eukprot:TRINITY_DN242_c0_g1_i8.p1 TRINITY_DN242_c0_g1~~TRINITY_DN242_c0_g1_i8.p1  ORF type:complete len:175 (+),score=62.39 TRINITY_DN242_c0_g1_i8:58-525(+)